jgi:hypothetical protein
VRGAIDGKHWCDLFLPVTRAGPRHDHRPSTRSPQCAPTQAECARADRSADGNRARQHPDERSRTGGGVPVTESSTRLGGRRPETSLLAAPMAIAGIISAAMLGPVGAIYG